MGLADALKEAAFAARSAPTLARWQRTKRAQREAFERLRGGFEARLASLPRKGHDPFVLPFWEGAQRRIEAALRPAPPLGFLRLRPVRGTLVSIEGGKLLRERVAFLESRLPRGELARLLEEDLVGLPYILEPRYRASQNSVDHLGHLARFEHATGRRVRDLRRIAEWGGGYGGLAKVAARAHPGCTYTILDLPLMSCLQWLYLASVLGEDRVVLHAEPRAPAPGKVNLLPLPVALGRPPEADLFVSTWALSESAPPAVDFVEGARWFGAEHRLLAYHRIPEFPAAERVAQAAARAGAREVPVEGRPGHAYAFR